MCIGKQLTRCRRWKRWHPCVIHTFTWRICATFLHHREIYVRFREWWHCRVSIKVKHLSIHYIFAVNLILQLSFTIWQCFLQKFQQLFFISGFITCVFTESFIWHVLAHAIFQFIYTCLIIYLNLFGRLTFHEILDSLKYVLLGIYTHFFSVEFF